MKFSNNLVTMRLDNYRLFLEINHFYQRKEEKHHNNTFSVYVVKDICDKLQ